jgi:phosphotransferase system HPr (HPr) family protein
VIEQEVEIVNRLGLHARAAAKLVHLAGRHQCDVSLVHDGEEVDAKSILGILLLAAGKGSRLTVRCAGEDEDEAMESITELFSLGFGEES